MNKNQSVIDIQNEQDIVNARQLVRFLAKEMTFSQIDQTRITTVVSELARNILLYAQKGHIILEQMTPPYQPGIKIIAKDRGPGIKNIRKVLTDGYSTSGGLGAGLPGVKRIMDEFTIHSTESTGTEIITTKINKHNGTNVPNTAINMTPHL